MHMQQQISLHHLLKRAFEGLDQFGWQLADEADGVSDHRPASRGKAQAAHGWIKRGKQHVLREDASACQTVEKGRFSGVCIAYQRERRRLTANPVASLQMARALNLLQLFPDPNDAVHQHPPVKFDLPLARTTQKATTTALALEVGPAAHKTAALEGERRKLNLQATSMSLRPCAKDFQDERCPVDHLGIGDRFQIALLHGSQGGIDDNQRMIRLVGKCGQTLGMALAKKGGGTRPGKGHHF